MTMQKKYYEKEINSRRCFGIISHPDAGKTTLTEKLLLFGGAIQMAGAIKSRKTDRYATSDWMKIEQQRGISVTTSVMKFHYRDYEINLLDTPGHKDFSEDTYRVLTAVDSALMVVDSVAGVETQTEKLMGVCRIRNTPIMTFINKMDRAGKEPLDLMHEIEDKLQIECTPLSWPIGSGKGFKGVYNIYRNELLLYRAGSARKPTDLVQIKDLNDPNLDKLLGKDDTDSLRDDLELILGASDPFELEHYLKGSQTPVFFGSALNNFGVRELLDAFVELAPPPREVEAETRMVSPYEKDFTGFAFKIQANMDLAHRDRIAFVRICSGKFARGMKLMQQRTGKEMTISNATIFIAQDRQNVEEAYAGDIIGIHNHGTIQIGDTFTVKEPLKFVGIPSFAPEIFKRIILKNPLRAKQLDKGLTQLSEEGAIQVFRPLHGNDYIIGAIGILQIDVTVSRLKEEYSVDAVYENMEYSVARWFSSSNASKLEEFKRRYASDIALDTTGGLTFMASDKWRLNYIMKEWPEIEFFQTREIQ